MSSDLSAVSSLKTPSLKSAYLRGQVELCAAFIRNAFLNMLAYRLRYFMGIITYVLFASVNYFVWQAVYAQRTPGERINGFTINEMVTYVCIGWISRSMYFSSIDEEIDELVRSGQISIFLLRPVHFHLMMICQAAGESLFRLLFFSTPILAAILLLYPVMLPPSFGVFILFSFSTVFSFFIFAELNFIVGMLSFYLKSIEGITRAKYFLTQLLSGLLLPLSFFPAWLRPAIEILPFKNIAFVPLQMYLGKVAGMEILWLFISQTLWLFLLVVAGQLLWKKAVRRLTLQGG